MAAGDAKPIPIKNQAYRVTFPILDADGDLVSGATSLDSEVSIDAGTFTDCTNEATEIATNSGIYYLDMTSAEMNGDTIAIIIKTATAGAKTTPIVLYPSVRGLADLAYPTVSGRSIDVSAGGEVGVDWANVGSPTTTVNLSGTTIATTQKVDVETIKTNPVVNGGTITFPTGATLASTTNITAGTITTVSGNVNGSAGSVTGAVGSVTGNVGGNVTGSVGSVASGGITSGSFAAGAINAAAIAADAIGASELAADAVAEIADAVWDEAISGHLSAGSTGAALNAAGSAGDPWTTPLPGAYGAGTAGNIIGNNLNTTVSSRASQTSVDAIDDYVDTEVAAIKAKTDQLTFTVAGRVDSTTQAGVSTLDASGVRAAVGLAAANLDIQLTAIDDYLDTEIAAIKAKTDNLPASPAAVGSAMTLATDAVSAAALATDAVNEITAAVKALVVESQGSYSLGQVLSIMLAALAGVTSDSGATLKTPNGSATRIAATVNGSNERTAMVLTPSS